MINTRNVSKGMKFLSVVLGTLAGGFLWRCRGESGWGSSWGLYAVGLVLLLLIWQFYGRKKGMYFELIPIGALLTGLGVTGYGTVIDQMAGVLYSDLPYQGEVVYSPISPWSGALIILIMGLTLIPLYAFFIGTLFSEKEYKIKHYIIAIAIFFVVGYVMKASLSHVIVKLINPEQVNYAALGLADAGYDYASPFSAYMHHFAQRSWTQEIPYFENYYMSVEHVSDLIAFIAMILYALIGRRDKITAGVSAFIAVFTGIATTALSPLISAQFHSGFFEDRTLPAFLMDGGWGLWEFLTGAAVGFATMFIIALLPDKYTAQTEEDEGPMFENKIFRFVFDLIAIVFVFGVAPARVIGIRLGKFLRYEEIFKDGDTVGTVVMIVLSVIFGVYMIFTLKKNVLDENGAAFKKTPVEFSFIALPAYMLMACGAYFFLNHAYLLHLPYGEMTSVSGLVSAMTSGDNTVTTVMIVTFILFSVIYFPLRKKIRKT